MENVKANRTKTTTNFAGRNINDNSEAVTGRGSMKKVFSEILPNSQEKTCARVSFLQVFSRNFCEISKNSLLYRTPPVAASYSSPKTSFIKNNFLNSNI